MKKIVKIVDFIEKKTQRLCGEIVFPDSLKKNCLLHYIEKRVEQLNTGKENQDYLERLSSENEISFLLKLKERILND